MPRVDGHLRKDVRILIVGDNEQQQDSDPRSACGRADNQPRDGSVCRPRPRAYCERAAAGRVFRLYDDPGRNRGQQYKMKELADERGWKVTQNVVTGLAGFVVPVIWFGMDWKGSVDKDAAALQARQQYLTTLAEQRCQPGYRPPPPPQTYAAPRQ